MDNKQGSSAGKQPTLGRADNEKAKKRGQPDTHHGYEEGKHTPQSEVMRKHRRVRP
jgi:hypothetical protein